MKTKEEVLAEVTDRELYELYDKGVIPIIDVDDICTAMEQYATQQVDAATANHDQEIADFCEWATAQYWYSADSWQSMLTKFRKSK